MFRFFLMIFFMIYENVHMTGYAGSRVASSVHRTRKERIGNCHDRVGIIFFRGRLGSVWGSSQRLQVPYLIPRPGVTRHIYKNKNSTQTQYYEFLVVKGCYTLDLHFLQSQKKDSIIKIVYI